MSVMCTAPHLTARRAGRASTLTSTSISTPTSTRRPPCAALVALLSLGLASTAGAQSLSYDMKTTGQGMGRASSPSETRVFMAAHGQFSNGNARLDFTESPMPGGMMGQGTYMIVKSESSVSTFVDPAKRQYYEIDRNDLAKTAAAAQQMTSGLVKTDVSGIAVTAEPLGPGEAIEGYATTKYRITDAYAMSISVMGRNSKTTEHSTTDLWIAPALDGVMNPMSRQAPPASGGSMDALTAELTKAYGKIGKGVVLRTARTSVSETDGKTRTSTMTTEISNIKRASISPAVFTVPSDYTKTAGLQGGLGALGAIGDSLKAARVRADKAGGPATSDASPGNLGDTVKSGMTQGASDGTKQATTDATKAGVTKAIGKLFGRP
jgi:hypothetical protein